MAVCVCVCHVDAVPRDEAFLACTLRRGRSVAVVHSGLHATRTQWDAGARRAATETPAATVVAESMAAVASESAAAWSS